MTTVAQHRPRGRKQKMAARASAERAGVIAAAKDAADLYLLVYAARGQTGPYPLPTLRHPGLIDTSTMPVIGR